jgi:hypothetical protein
MKHSLTPHPPSKVGILGENKLICLVKKFIFLALMATKKVLLKASPLSPLCFRGDHSVVIDCFPQLGSWNSAPSIWRDSTARYISISFCLLPSLFVFLICFWSWMIWSVLFLFFEIYCSFVFVLSLYLVSWYILIFIHFSFGVIYLYLAHIFFFSPNHLYMKTKKYT